MRKEPEPGASLISIVKSGPLSDVRINPDSGGGMTTGTDIIVSIENGNAELS